MAWLERVIADVGNDPLAHQLAKLDPQIRSIADAVQCLEAVRQDPQPLKQHVRRLKDRRAQVQKDLDKKLATFKNELLERKRRGLPPDLQVAYAVSEGKVVDESVQIRGEPDNRGAVVKRAVPRFLAGENPRAFPTQASGRLELAEWLTRHDNPLTARVMVNRIWQHHFGTGIVATPSNFGLRGEPPTHPELLDWLASRFVESGWSIKAMHRLILLSKTYQLASDFDAEGNREDPANRYYWRQNRRRLDAESIRDAMLALGGHLELERPGPHPFPPITQWGWTQHSPFKAVYPSNHRSVFLMTQRLQRHPYLALFDGPDTNNSTDVRTNATVPLQALYLMNNPFVRQQAEGFAKRVLSASSDDGERTRLAIALAWGRSPKEGEVDACLAYVHGFARELTGVSDQNEQVAWSSLTKVMLSSNEFLYVD